MKFDDLNANGVEGRGRARSARLDDLRDYNGNGALDAGEPIARSPDARRRLLDHRREPGDVQGARGAAGRLDPARSRTACFHQRDASRSGAEMTDNDFGNYRNATKSGIKFED